MCGKWETYPREFAKCRRCRKAKYCGKECQSTAWSEGHRFWCSAKDVEEESINNHQNGGSSGNDDQNIHHHSGEASSLQAPPSTRTSTQVSDDGSEQASVSVTGGSVSNSRTERRHRERHHHNFNPSAAIHPSSTSSTNYVSPTTIGGVRAEPSMTRDRTIVQSTQTGSSFPSHVRQMLMATIRPSTVQESSRDPISTVYLPFDIQGNAGSSGGRETGRRRAETITGVGIPTLSSSSFSSTRVVSEEDGSMIPSSSVRTTGTGQQLQMSYTQTITQSNVNLHPHGHVRVSEDWAMTSPVPSPRSLRMSETVSRSRSEDREDDMVLG